MGWGHAVCFKLLRKEVGRGLHTPYCWVCVVDVCMSALAVSGVTVWKWQEEIVIDADAWCSTVAAVHVVGRHHRPLAGVHAAAVLVVAVEAGDDERTPTFPMWRDGAVRRHGVGFAAAVDAVGGGRCRARRMAAHLRRNDVTADYLGTRLSCAGQRLQ